MLGPFATASRRMPPVLHCHSPGGATVARRHCRTPPAHRCPQQQRQRMTGDRYGPMEWAQLPTLIMADQHQMRPAADTNY